MSNVEVKARYEGGGVNRDFYGFWLLKWGVFGIMRFNGLGLQGVDEKGLRRQSLACTRLIEGRNIVNLGYFSGKSVILLAYGDSLLVKNVWLRA